jgi:hypothetical protein
VAADFDLHPNDKTTGQRTPGRTVIPFDSGRRGISDGWLIDSNKPAARISRKGFWPRRLPLAGPACLLGIALLCTLYPGLKKWTAGNPKPAGQVRSEPASQLSSAVQPVADPAPAHPAMTARSEGSILPERRPSKAVSSRPGVAATQYHPVKYEATHKNAFGGCTGQLELTSGALHFRCSHHSDLDIPVSSIAGTHKDGVVLESGEKYHFLIANHTKGQVEMIFDLWLNRVRQLHQASGKSSL